MVTSRLGAFRLGWARTRGELVDSLYLASDSPDMAINAGLRALGIKACGRRNPMPLGDIRGGCRQRGHAAGSGNDPDQ